MASFSYTALNRRGGSTQGILQADTEQQVSEQLLQQGLTPLGHYPDQQHHCPPIKPDRLATLGNPAPEPFRTVSDYPATSYSAGCSPTPG